MLTPNASSNMQKHWYLGCFHAGATRENISEVWGIGGLEWKWCHHSAYTLMLFLTAKLALAVIPLSISISSTAQHWDSSPMCSKWPPSGSRHSWGSNTHSTGSQCCIWYDWPSALTSYTGIIIWYQRQGFGLVPVVSNWSHSNSSDQEINIWAAQVEIWCATGVHFGPHSIHHLHHTTGPTYQEAWSDFPSICRRYPALFSI